MYNGMLQMSATFVATIFVYLLLIEGNPLPVFRRMFTEKIFVIYLTAILSVTGLDLVELSLEKFFGHLVNWDMTLFISRLEGNFTEVLQKTLMNNVLTNITAFFYVFVFPALVWLAMAVFNRYRNKIMMKKLLLVFVLNYIMVLPFYLFFPVNEAWSAHTGIQPLIKEVYPAFDTQYRSLSGLNNCFPSLHTSLSVSIALLAIHSGYKRLAWVISLSSAVIVFSTLYLGIHWFTDVTSGLAAALVVVNLAIAWVDGSVPVVAKVRRTLSLLTK